jgi:hypothetical protein
MWIVISILSLLVVVMSWIIFNLTNKNIKLEEYLFNRDEIIVEMSKLITTSEKKLKELDTLGAFESDDEIGFFFNTVKAIQAELNKFKI